MRYIWFFDAYVIVKRTSNVKWEDDIDKYNKKPILKNNAPFF